MSCNIAENKRELCMHVCPTQLNRGFSRAITTVIMRTICLLRVLGSFERCNTVLRAYSGCMGLVGCINLYICFHYILQMRMEHIVSVVHF